MRVLALLILLMLPLFFSGSAFADYYRYVDNRGISHFTDNIADVPAEYLNTMESYTVSNPDRDADDEINDIPPDHEEKKKNRLAYIQLSKEKQALEEEMSELNRQRDALTKEKEQITSPAEFDAFEKKVAQFNEKVEVFQSRRNAFEKEIEEFNARNTE